MYACIATIYNTYYGTWGRQTDKTTHSLSAPDIDALYEVMGQFKVDNEEDHGGSEGTTVGFGAITRVAETIPLDKDRIQNSKAVQKRDAAIAAEAAAEIAREAAYEEAQEARDLEEFERLSIKYGKPAV